MTPTKYPAFSGRKPSRPLTCTSLPPGVRLAATPFFRAGARLFRWTDCSQSPVASSQLPAAPSGLRRGYTPVFSDGRPLFPDGSRSPAARCVFSAPFFFRYTPDAYFRRLPLPVASSSLCSPGRVFRRFLLLPSVPQFVASSYCQVRASFCLVASLRSLGFAVFVDGPFILTAACLQLPLPGSS